MKQFTFILTMLLMTGLAYANPAQPTVTQGTATFSPQGSQLTIHTSDRTLINWSSFNIGVSETTRFVEPSANSIVWNRINDSNPSQILGHLEANGLIVLQNQSGFYVGGDAAIRAHGLVMTTAPCAPLDISSGSSWQFTVPPPTASIINYGQINTGKGGSVYLIAHDVENHGSITAPNGNIGLSAGQDVLMSRSPDGRGLSAQVRLPVGSVDNTGRIVADAGTIALNAQVVNQGGMIQANSVREQNGVIEVYASDTLTLGPSSVIQANGDTHGASAGGNVTLRSGNTFQDDAASHISVTGGIKGGNGGVVDISAPVLPAIHSAIDGQAARGYRGGRLVIDPTDIKIGNTGTGSANGGTVGSGDSPATLNLNVNTAFTGFSQIDLQASHDITISDNTTWDLVASTGMSGPGCQLTLEAGNNINVGTSRGANIFGGAGWSLTLEAGRDFSTPNGVTPGTGIIKLAGSGTLQTQDGSIHLLAGDSITVNTGAVRTMNGGSIDATAVSGSIDTGRNANGYNFSSTGYTVSGNLGGISTGAGGDVMLTAGGDITSFLPTGTSSSPTDAGSGAFGPEPGVVRVTAGGNVFGHFVAANSTQNGSLVASTITAQNGNAGSDGNLLALSLVRGGWQVSAPNGDIFLQEVRNPNGMLNGKSGSFKHLFDYDLGSFVDLTAGNGVYLEGALLPRFTGDDVPVIYPPSLDVHAGAGGITLGNNLTLYPSSEGELHLTTTGGGSLEGAGYTLSLSDSSANVWDGVGDFSQDHATTPVQLNNPNPVVMDISGNVENLTLRMAKETQMTVGGDMNNTSFTGQNLHASDVTSINVAGRIFNQSTYSFVTTPGSGLAVPPPRFPADHANDYLQYLKDAVVPGTGPTSANGGALFPSLNLFYVPGTQQLGYSGKMDAATLQLLSGPLQVKTYLLNGRPALDANGNFVTKTVTFGVDAATLQNLYAASQNAIDVRDAPQGFQIGGPGQFNISAHSLDLGVSGGINSIGPAGNHALARLPGTGADINLNVTGDLDLFSSQISSLFGGAINLNVGGTINAGVQNLPLSGDPFAAHGIWTSGPNSDIHIVAGGDVLVNGSRIAVYDGGNVFIESLHGNVDTGTGNSSEIKVNEVIVNPVTFEVSTPQQPVAGSGIIVGTLPDAPARISVGGITIQTPEGSISIGLGGITMIALNGQFSSASDVRLSAGTLGPHNTIVHHGDINGSGVIFVYNLHETAAGNIHGTAIALHNATVVAAQNITGTFLAGQQLSLSGGEGISAIAIGGQGVQADAPSFTGVVFSQNVSGGAGAKSALESSASSGTGSQTAAAGEGGTEKTQQSSLAAKAEDELKKMTKRALLAKYVGRVTVLLPGQK